jgi:hypothetical protein
MNSKYAVVVSAILSSVTSAYSQRVSPEVEHVASAMFEHFETVSYTKTDFLVDYDRAHNSRTVLSSEADHHTYASSEDYLILPFIKLLAELQSLGPDTAMHFEGGFDEVVGGAKDFTAPQGLGMADSTSCSSLLHVRNSHVIVNVTNVFISTELECHIRTPTACQLAR